MQTRQKSFFLARRRRYERYVRSLIPLWWLPCREVAGTIAVNGAYGGGVGAELFTNPGVVNGVGSVYAFTGNNPDGYTITGESGSDPEITEVAAGEAHVDSPTGGGGHVNLYSSAAGVSYHENVVVVGDTYRSVVDINKATSGAIVRSSAVGATNYGSNLTAAGVTALDVIAAGNTGFGLKRATGTGDDFTIAGHSVKKVGELDALIAGTTLLAQTGKHWAQDAYDFDGATSILTLANRAAIQGLDEFTLFMLFNPADAGEGDNGALFSKASEFELRFNAVTRELTATVNYGTTDATATTSTALAAAAWQAVALKIDDTNKTIAILIDGVEASYASNIAGVGTRASNTNDLIVGNNVGVTQTLDALVDEVLMVGRALTDREVAYLGEVV